ncbi:MAG: hypothetical protein DRI61_14575 [Chloroflexi bacterium]|nr:MAG: hypothetical protein DRI61_14575 [Chloroflexota bacterium]
MDEWPLHGWAGLFLIAICWPLNWILPGPRTHLLFFPLWLGFTLTFDALVFLRKGHSLLSRNRNRFISLFLISVPVWWIFEFLNWRVQNWHYLGREHFSNLEYACLASLNFSTVIPAVFEASELISTFLRKPLGENLRFQVTPSLLRGMAALGVVSLALLLLWPRYFFPFLWISLFLILDSLNYALGHRSILGYVSQGEWRPLLSLWGGVMICAFFWEFWNYWAYPKWFYTIPFFDFLHIFEMPLLGYGGYLPFSLELFAFYHLVEGLLRLRGPYDVLPY